MNLVPINNKLIVKQIEPEDITEGGIVLPDAARTSKNFGTVIETGQDVTVVQKGDVILFSSYAGDEFESDKETYLILSETDIHAIQKGST